MRQRDKAGGKAKARRHKAATPKRRNTPKAGRPRSSSPAGRETNVARLGRELSEALERQAATAEILNVISNSPADTQPVFDAIVQSGLKLFPDALVSVALRYGDRIDAAAVAAPDPARVEAWRSTISRTPLARNYMHGAALLDRRMVDISDVADAPAEFAAGGQNFLTSGNRAITIMPMMRGDEAIGALSVVRHAPGPLSDKQIMALRTFAAQAVIAIENTRLINETREALERETSSADILRVISSSPTDVQPVFDAIVASLLRLFGTQFAVVQLLHDGNVTMPAVGGKPGFERLAERFPRPLDDTTIGGLVMLSKQTRQFMALEDTATPAGTQRFARDFGFNSVLFAPMIHDGRVIGGVGTAHPDAKAFNPHQIALIETFARQAVIAIRNARMFEEIQARTVELTESLQQQTATADVLKVISRSVFDLKPVLDGIARVASNLCAADDVTILIRDGDNLRFTAHHGSIPQELGILRPVSRGWVSGRAVVDRRPIHVHDLAAAADDYPLGRQFAERLGHRTTLAVPLLRGDEALGCMLLRRLNVDDFTDKQIGLLQTFADQAVIAIENVRLFEEVQARTRELSESLQQQTATAEVLQVINESPNDLGPVFDAMLEKAMRLCDAAFGNFHTYDGERVHTVAVRGASSAYVEFFKNSRGLGPGNTLWSLVHGESLVHIADAADSEGYRAGEPRRRAVVDIGGARTILAVPLRKDDLFLGAFVIYRREVRLFSEKQIALLQNFAAQAVIAMENVRLISEQRESLRQQTATADVLKVISRSTFDLQTVLRTLVESAAHLCEADKATITRQKDGVFFRAESHGFSEEFRDYVRTVPIEPEQGSAIGRALLEGRVVHIPDVENDLNYTFVEGQKLGGFRTILSVPMLREGVPIGVLALTRDDVRPFSDKQIELVSTFADQAAIAIENVRLFDEVQAKTRDLTEALQFQTASADVLKVISRSPDTLQPVLDVIVDTSRRLCNSISGVIFLLRDGKFHVAAEAGTVTEAIAFLRTNPIAPDKRETAVMRAVLKKRTIHVPNTADDPGYDWGGPLGAGGGPRALLSVPLMHDGQVIGAILLRQSHLTPFTSRQIEAVETFADQAVIAISNVNLFEQVQQRTRELTQSLEDLRAAQDRLVQTEKLASLGQLTAGIAHEIKNPLNFVNNFSAVSIELVDELKEALQGPLDDKARAEAVDLMEMLAGNLDKVVQHGKRADSIVKNMLLHSRANSGERRPVDINSIVEESLNLAYHGARAEKPGFNITLERSFDPTAGEVDVFPQEITRVLLNLISNGFYATSKRLSESGAVAHEPTLAVATRNLGDRVEIRIRDNGTGIPADVKDKMFNPFFTTKPAGEGTGLGLSLSHDIVVKQHAGTIEVDTRPGEFTEFRVVLPRSSASAVPPGGRA